MLGGARGPSPEETLVFWTSQNEGGADSELSVPMAQISDLQEHPLLTFIGSARLLECSSLTLKMQPVISNVPIVTPSRWGPMPITTG